MSNSICGYNCSEHPAPFFDADFSGPGVLVGYITTAGMVVVVIILHYLLAYRPDLDAPQSNYGKWHNVEKLWQRLVGSIYYFPALALFLTARVILDHWSSMLFEIYWLVICFAVGLMGLLQNTNIIHQYHSLPADTDSNLRSFGQIIPVILLALPLVNIIEFLYLDEEEKNSSEENALSLLHTSPRATDDMHEYNSTRFIQYLTINTSQSDASSMFEPDQDYYHNSTSLKIGNLYIVLLEAIVFPFSVWLPHSPTAITTYTILINVKILIIPSLLWGLILLSLLIDQLVSKNAIKGFLSRRVLLIILQSASLICFTSTTLVLLIMSIEINYVS